MRDLQTRNTQAQEDMLDKRIDFERETLDRRDSYYDEPTVSYGAVPRIKRVPGIVDANGLLRIR